MVAGSEADTVDVRQSDIARHPLHARADFARDDGADAGELALVVGAADAHVLGGQHAMAAGEVVAGVVMQRADDRELVGDPGLLRIQLGDVESRNPAADRLPQAAVLGRRVRLHVVHVHVAGTAVEPDEDDGGVLRCANARGGFLLRLQDLRQSKARHAGDPQLQETAAIEAREGSRHRQNAPYQRMRTQDGYLMIGAAGQAIWERCAAALGHAEWSSDPRFATNSARMQNRAALEAGMEAVLTTNTTEHWVGMLEAAGVPCGPVYNYGQMFADPQVKHREMVHYASDIELGDVPHIRTPVKIGDSIKVRAVAPKLGEHNAEIYEKLGYGAADLAALKAKSAI